MNHDSTEVSFDDVRDTRPTRWSRSRATISSDPRRYEPSTHPHRVEKYVGDGTFFFDRAFGYLANERIMFSAQSGVNQGVAFPLARAYARLEAANLMPWKAATVDTSRSCRPRRHGEDARLRGVIGRTGRTPRLRRPWRLRFAHRIRHRRRLPGTIFSSRPRSTTIFVLAFITRRPSASPRASSPPSPEDPSGRSRSRAWSAQRRPTEVASGDRTESRLRARTRRLRIRREVALSVACSRFTSVEQFRR